MRSTTLLLAAFFCLAGSPMLAAEGGRLAFVVGVDQYENLPPEAQLSVAVADAKRMKTTLESLDPPFTVRMVADGDVRGIEAAFDAFLDEAKGAECALVYFAGHGVEYHGANFLLVKDTAISDISADVERMKRRLATEAVSLQGWVDSLDATRAQVKVVILDCCRDNPLKAEDGSGTRSVVGGSRGLAQVTPPSGTLISYSADAGQRANDGLFTEVLANNLKTPGLNILKVFAKTREEVREISTAWAEEDATRGLAPDSRRSRHEPAEYNKLNLAGTDFAFTRGVPVAVKVEEPDPKMSEAEIERRAKEMAEKLVAEAMKKQPAPSIPTKPAAPVARAESMTKKPVDSSAEEGNGKMTEAFFNPTNFGFERAFHETSLEANYHFGDGSKTPGCWIIADKKIVLAHDTDLDGAADRASNFADLDFAEELLTGDTTTLRLEVIEEGVQITKIRLLDGPKAIAEITDTDGDMRADSINQIH